MFALEVFFFQLSFTALICLLIIIAECVYRAVCVNVFCSAAGFYVFAAAAQHQITWKNPPTTSALPTLSPCEYLPTFVYVCLHK